MDSNLEVLKLFLTNYFTEIMFFGRGFVVNAFVLY